MAPVTHSAHLSVCARRSALNSPSVTMSLIETRHYGLAVIGVAYVAVAIYYYFKIVRSMFIREEMEKTPALATTFGLRIALALTGIATLAIGIYPEPFLRLAQTSLFR